MALEAYQQEIISGTLYEVKNSGRGQEREDSAIEVIGGSGVNIYGSINEPTSPPEGMFLTASGFRGIDTFDFVPNYLYIQGTASKIVVSSIVVEEA